MKKFNWPLAKDSFTFFDKVKIGSWIVKSDRYTMGEKVAEFENKMKQLSGRFALGVCNGSAANQLVFELWKTKHPNKKATVIVPAVTWASSITPAIMAGMDIIFCDVNLDDFSFDYIKLELILQQNKGKDIIIWPTALIGFVPDMLRLKLLAEIYNVDLFLDSCENTFSFLDWDQSILASTNITTTSCYFSHQITSIEFGFVFFEDENDYKIAKMLRNHGMVRSLNNSEILRKNIEKENISIDPQFLFAISGTNLRPTDVHAMFGLQDFNRIEKYRVHRNEIYNIWSKNLDRSKYYLPNENETHTGFCLPIFTIRNDQILGDGSTIKIIKRTLNNLGIESRPLIGGNLLRQPCFKQYGKAELFENAEWIHNNGTYIGLHNGVTEEMVFDLTEILNNL